jgi:hypothetical protein
VKELKTGGKVQCLPSIFWLFLLKRMGDLSEWRNERGSISMSRVRPSKFLSFLRRLHSAPFSNHMSLLFLFYKCLVYVPVYQVSLLVLADSGHPISPCQRPLKHIGIRCHPNLTTCTCISIFPQVNPTGHPHTLYHAVKVRRVY